jgi:TonB family protein
MIRASVILLIALAITWLLRKRAAAERHVVWAAAIVSAAMLPLLSFVLPSWEPALARRVAAALPSISAPSSSTSVSRPVDVIFRAEGIETATRVWTIVWFAGAVAGFLVFATGVIRQRSLAGRSTILADSALAGFTRDVARQVGCRRGIRLRRSLDQPMPMTWGVFRPQILLPRFFDEWPDERKRVVIAHELSHVRRLDCLFQTLAQIACAVYWFNPLFWIACNQLYRESEQACDDAVIRLGIDARDYASHLLWIARAVRQSGGVWSATLAMARQSTLEKRFAALLKTSRNRRSVTRNTVLCVAGVAIALVAPLAAIRVSTNEAAPATVGPQIDQYTTPPLYSDAARMRGIEGVVTLEAVIGSDGTVRRLRVAKGLGHGLDENALLAVRDWRFVPARQNGTAVEATTRVDVEFSLRNAELNEEIANDMATRIGPGVSPPQVIHRVEPQYPAVASRQVPSGTVVLDAVILEDGTPKIVRVIRSLDWALDEIAINALEQWRFSPAMKDGVPARVRMNIAVAIR